MQLTDGFWRDLNNPGRRWFLFSSPVNITLSPLQIETIRNDYLLTDPTRPRRAYLITRDRLVVGTYTEDDYRLLIEVIHTDSLNGNYPIRNIVNTALAADLQPEAENTVQAREDREALEILVHDLQLRYTSCYFFFKGRIYYSIDFSINSDKIVASAYSIKDGDLYKLVYIDYSDELVFSLPKLGYINYNSFSIFAERNYNTPSSYKYKRGFNDASCTFHLVSDRELKACNIYHSLGDPVIPKRVVEHIFIKDYPSYDEALEKVLSFSNLSCAFSSTLCIKLESLYNKFTLLKNTWTIAEYDPTIKSWRMLTNTFNEELSKLNIPHVPL